MLFLKPVADTSADHPRPRAQRTLTLIAKALQSLANLSTFGGKEPWMEPMNTFLTTRRQEFKDFVDNICAISPDRANSAIPASYATPITILGRLPGTSREGFPSLPYLIDQARECASLVELWLTARNEVDHSFPWTEELKTFDALCERLRQRKKDCLSQAEQAERPSGTLEPKWEELVEQMERKARFRQQSAHSSPGTPMLQKTSNTVNSSTSSFGESYFSPHAVPPRRSPGYNLSATDNSNCDTVRSRDEISESAEDEETDRPTSPPGSSSAVWDPGVAHRRPSTIKTTLSPRNGNIDYAQHLSHGSSTFSLDASTDRDYANPVEPISPISGSEAPVGKSLYSLPSPRSTPHKYKSSRSKPGSRDGQEHSHRHKHEPRQKSMYRLPSNNNSSQTADLMTPRNTASRDGKEKHRFGDFGAVFKRKPKSSESDDRGFIRY